MNYNIKISFDNKLKEDIKKLIYYLNNSGFYKSIIKNKKRLDDITYDKIGETGIILKSIPYKMKLSLKKKSSLQKALNNSCALCDAIEGSNKIEPLNLAKSLLWRGYIIRPNDFPYMDDHLLIMSSDHNHGLDGLRGSQSELHLNLNIMTDMFDFYKLMGKQGTMFFNGMAGNTQLHFHFHYTSNTLPIQKYLYEYQNNNDKITQYKTLNQNNLFIFNSTDKNCYNGIFFYGLSENLVDDIFPLIKKIKKKGLEYNVIFMSNHKDDNSDNISGILYMRDNSKLKKSDPALGASIVAGYYTRDDIFKKEVKQEKIHKYIKRICSAAVVVPDKEILKFLIE